MLLLKPGRSRSTTAPCAVAECGPLSPPSIIVWGGRRRLLIVPLGTAICPFWWSYAYVFNMLFLGLPFSSGTRGLHALPPQLAPSDASGKLGSSSTSGAQSPPHRNLSPPSYIFLPSPPHTPRLVHTNTEYVVFCFNKRFLRGL